MEKGEACFDFLERRKSLQFSPFCINFRPCDFSFFNLNLLLDCYSAVRYGEKITSCPLSFACWHLVSHSFSQ